MKQAGNFIGYLKRVNVQAFVVAFFGAFLLFPGFFEVPVYTVNEHASAWASLDPSWKLALNKANSDDLVWGRDLTITYGPLAFLSTRFGWGVDRISFLLFDLFVFLNFFFLFYTNYLKSNSRIITGLLILSAILCLPVYFGSATSLVLLAFLVFWIHKSLGEPGHFTYVMQVLLLLLLFFVKFNTGLITSVFFYCGLLYNFFHDKKYRKLIALYAVLPIAGILLLCETLNVALVEYTLGGINMVKGYNGIMYLDQDFSAYLWFSLLIALVLALQFGKKILADKTDRYKNLFSAFLVMCSVYVLYKQSFVRKDIQHVLDFPKYILLFVLACYSIYENQRVRTSAMFLLPLLGISVYFTNFYNTEFSRNRIWSKMKGTDYAQGFRNASDSSALQFYSVENRLPQRIKDRVGKNTVDAYPWNIHFLFANGLNYVPRPVPQAYMAYTPYLENLNFEFYKSGRAPRYVFYEYLAIDNRYPLFDETKLHLSLFCNYSCADTFYLGNRLVLLLEQTQKRNITFKKVREFDLKIRDRIQPKLDMYYEVHISNSFHGKCISFVKHAPVLSLQVKTKNGQQREFRTSIDLLRTGIFSDRFFASTEDLMKFFNKDTLDASNMIEYYSFLTTTPGLFEDKIKITEYQILY